MSQQTYPALSGLKEQIFRKEYHLLNPPQQEAVLHTEGPLLILAGAGSGKTTVLIHRIAHLLEFGNTLSPQAKGTHLSEVDLAFLQDYADDKVQDRERMVSLVATPTVRPWNVLAITFTNKAAGELRERLCAKLGDEIGGAVSCGTFHAICSRILRREIELLGYTSSFTIYDTDDSVRVLKDCMTELAVPEKMFPPKGCLAQISRFKDAMTSVKDLYEQAKTDFRLKTIVDLYVAYQKRLKVSNALDFDDIILLTVKLFLQHPDVLERYQRRFAYILVDEYQDTNQVQYKLIKLLAQAHQNICVVGDDDQSIYKFRGATIENILGFEHQFHQAKVIRLEQNYRSTQTILDAANALISNNQQRKKKTLWTSNGEGEKIQVFQGMDDFDESQFIIEQIQKNVSEGMTMSDHAVLYRMNAQSNTIERSLVKSGLSYKIVGGTKFFDRKEVRDMLAYLHLINNPADGVRLKRIIVQPKRGIGDSTLQTVETIAVQTGVPMLEIMRTAEEYQALSKKSRPLIAFATLIEELATKALSLPLDQLLEEILDTTGYRVMLQQQGVEGRVRLENIEELKSNLVKYGENAGEDATLSGFLEEVALYTDLDNLNQTDDKVTLMTVHAAKGLEFSVVFLLGWEEGIFPSQNASVSEEEIGEERRLAYVAITRAKQQLYITHTRQRMLFGSTNRNQPSRFLKELPDQVKMAVTKQSEGYAMHTAAKEAKHTKAAVALPTSPAVALSGYATNPTPNTANYTVGERVTHKMFGEGMVLSMTPMGNDTLVEISFDRVGTKKMMQNFAKVKKI